MQIYTSKVHGKKADTTGSDPKHSGKEGHWLEKQMGVEPNASNTPNITTTMTRRIKLPIRCHQRTLAFRPVTALCLDKRSVIPKGLENGCRSGSVNNAS